MATSMVDKVKECMKDPTQVRNISIAAHIDHGKTTLSDNLLAGAGMISSELAGSQRVMDFKEDEQERGITIDSANVSMVHIVNDEEFLINLIDTPGHVDFGGDVTRAMRAVDGTVVVLCAVEGMMPQTETVLRQALKERVKPILFINKVDRLIKELQLTPQAMQERFVGYITKTNQFIKKVDPKCGFQVNVQDGSVCFGSAFHNWALSIDYMQKHGISFQDVISAYQGEEDAYKELAKKAPLHDVLLTAVVKHIPNPLVAQKSRIPKIWHGDLESSYGKSLINCDPAGPVAFGVIKIVMDKHAGEVCAGRLFSGTVRKGMEVYLAHQKKKVRLQQVFIYKGPQRIQVDEIPAGNILGLVGLSGALPGETVTTAPDMEPFEEVKHLFEPVVTKAVEAKSPSDLPRLIEIMKQVIKEDPSIHIQINEDTGEHLMSGMGELHLEVIENRIRTEKGLDIKTSPPIVVYREAIQKKTPAPVEGKSPNKHNKLYFTVEPLHEEVIEAIKSGNIPEGRIKKKAEEVTDKFKELGWDTKEVRGIKEIFHRSVFVDTTRGIVHIREILEMVLDMFEEVMKAGPLAREPCIGMKVTLHDAKLHEDAIHRGINQIYPAAREGIRGAIAHAAPMIFEPIQIIRFVAPQEYMGEISKLISNKRGQLLDMEHDGDQININAKMPVAETFGLTNDLRSATGGRSAMFVVDQTFEKLPSELQQKVITQIKNRKGLSDAQTI